MCLLANCNRDLKRHRRPFDVRDFVPPDLRREFTARRSGMSRKALHGLKAMFKEQ